MSSEASVLLAASAADFATAYPIEEGRVRPHRVLDGDGFKIRLLTMDAGAVMREHRAPVPILVQVASGSIRFRVAGADHALSAGGAIQVPAGVLHELEAVEAAHVLLVLLG
ncbi:cupin domain-containing protein [Microbacterium sp. Mu-80]|uniref:Cupin domain-containing protein n=1 Tax=Microbacterium bandirmense TaxID=3122050 RepID=A0ABU8LEM7_9MICO